MTESNSTKVCSKCQIEKDISEFYKTPKGDYHCWCRPCCAEYAKSRRKKHKTKLKEQHKKRYEANRDKINEKRRQYRQDNLEYCREVDLNYAKKHRKENNEYSKNYREKNKAVLAEKMKIKRKENVEMFKERQSNQYQKNKDARKKQQREYNKTHKKEIAIRDKIYRSENKDIIAKRQKEYTEANHDDLLNYHKEYRKTEKGKLASKKGSIKHRALKKGATIEDFNPIDILERDNYICQHCGCKTRPNLKNKYHPKYPNIDHIIPLSKGGEHSRRNTQCLCHQCNIIKGNSGIGDQLRMFG